MQWEVHNILYVEFSPEMLNLHLLMRKHMETLRQTQAVRYSLIN